MEAALRKLVKDLRESARHHQHDHEGDDYHLGIGQGFLETAEHIESALEAAMKAAPAAELATRVERLERESALVWELLEYVGAPHDPWGELSAHAQKALDARKAGGR